MRRLITSSLALATAIIAFNTPSPAYAADVYYVKGMSYKDVLTYDREATKACIQGNLPAQPSARVVFTADNNQTFGWSPRNPDYYFINVGWADCKAFRKIQQGD